MSRSDELLRKDALAIWQAGVDAVRSDRLVRECMHVAGSQLLIGEEPIDLPSIRRIAVVGAGKAGAGMAAGLEEALGEPLMAKKELAGWINVPADCTRKLSRITTWAARPAGVNEPTEDGVYGAEWILDTVAALGPSDLCICLLSGGGSALLPAPVDGVTLTSKIALTRHLSAAGANIQELNTVRKQLSRIKGGGLARACRAGRLITLIISDVIGDPLDVIASGPTVEDTRSPQEALIVLQRLDPGRTVAASIYRHLENAAAQSAQNSGKGPIRCAVTNLVIGNNALAVDAAGIEAERRGYSHAMQGATKLEGPAEEVGVHLAEMAISMKSTAGPDCLITGGEPTVRLAPSELRGKGGRNQQLVLAALERLLKEGKDSAEGIVLLSGGTDGEDGPTDAAGAILTADVIARMRSQNLDPDDFLRRNDTYNFFERTGGLIKTGPTHTNVCDLRVITVSGTMAHD
ncbi:MAG: glycerate kinase type-2 family protein [Pirellulaceae bacterium]